MARRGEKPRLKKYRYTGPGKHWITVEGRDGKVTRRCAEIGERVELSDAAFAAFSDRFLDPDAPVPEEPGSEEGDDEVRDDRREERQGPAMRQGAGAQVGRAS